MNSQAHHDLELERTGRPVKDWPAAALDDIRHLERCGQVRIGTVLIRIRHSARAASSLHR